MLYHIIIYQFTFDKNLKKLRNTLTAVKTVVDIKNMYNILLYRRLRNYYKKEVNTSKQKANEKFILQSNNKQ